MDDLRIDVLFISISVISGRRQIDNDRLCAMNPPFRRMNGVEIKIKRKMFETYELKFE